LDFTITPNDNISRAKVTEDFIEEQATFWGIDCIDWMKEITESQIREAYPPPSPKDLEEFKELSAFFLKLEAGGQTERSTRQPVNDLRLRKSDIENALRAHNQSKLYETPQGACEEFQKSVIIQFSTCKPMHFALFQVFFVMHFRALGRGNIYNCYECQTQEILLLP